MYCDFLWCTVARIRPQPPLSAQQSQPHTAAWGPGSLPSHVQHGIVYLWESRVGGADGCHHKPLSSLQILLRDLFGSPAEEREVKEVICKTPEGRSTQSYNTYELAAKFLSPSLLPELLRPVKEVNAPCTLHGLHLRV